MVLEERKKALFRLGALEGDMDALLTYTANVFTRSSTEPDSGGGFLLFEWPAVWAQAQDLCENRLVCEIYESVAGTIPIIYAHNVPDFELLVRQFVYKGKEVSAIGNMGASFVSGKTLRFIMLSNKPYSGVSGSFAGLDEKIWGEKSMLIRKHHECAHYYTKKYFGSSRNNLHDELIADFCGLYAAFGEFRAAWFMKFFDARFNIYTNGLSEPAAAVVRALAAAASAAAERWAKTVEFQGLDEAGRIEALAEKDLLIYALA